MGSDRPGSIPAVPDPDRRPAESDVKLGPIYRRPAGLRCAAYVGDDRCGLAADGHEVHVRGDNTPADRVVRAERFR